MRSLSLILGATVLLAGCVSPAATVEPATDGAAPPVILPRVVVAVIDSGINVYHDAFQRNESLSDEMLAQFTNSLDGKTPERLTLTRDGDYEARVEADKALWEGLAPHTLYYFEGTRVLGISFEAEETIVLDDSGHGTGTSGSVLAQNPDAIVVLVEGITADSEAWAAMQDWVDFLSMSYGPIGSIPGTGPVFGLTTHEATELAWDNGKVPVGAADNTPAFAPTDETAGPPWVVGVAGDHSETDCREHGSGTAPDFTSDFTQELPRHDSVDETRPMSGTSFSTPKTAGTFSLVLHQVRTAWQHDGGITADGALAAGPDGATLTNAGLREAFQRTARYLPFNPTCGSGPVNPAAPWLQQGWGHVGPEIAEATTAHVLGTQAAPDKPAAAVQFQQLQRQVRETYWQNAPGALAPHEG